MGLRSVATGDGHAAPCIAPSFPCWTLGVPGEEPEGSNPAEVGVSVEAEEDGDAEDAGEEDKAASPASFRGCSWRMDSWKRDRPVSRPLTSGPSDKGEGFHKILRRLAQRFRTGAAKRAAERLVLGDGEVT